MINIFRTPNAAMIAQRQLEEAERLALEHEAAAEHHDALATMYRGRADRLRAYLAGSDDKPVDVKTGLRAA